MNALRKASLMAAVAAIALLGLAMTTAVATAQQTQDRFLYDKLHPAEQPLRPFGEHRGVVIHPADSDMPVKPVVVPVSTDDARVLPAGKADVFRLRSEFDVLLDWREPLGDWTIVGDSVLDPKDEKRLATKEGRGVAINGERGRTSHLFTKTEHGDIQAHIEFMVPKGSNSGVYFQGRYEIQILDSWGVEQPKHGDCGGIYHRWRLGKVPKGTPRGYEGRPPRVNASKKPGEWQSFDVVFRAPRFDDDGNKIANAVFVKVVHNGVLIHENQEVTGPTRAAPFLDEQPKGPLMLQGDHGPVAYRNIRLTWW